MWSSDVQPAGPIEIELLGSLWVRVFYTEHPTSVWGGCILKGTGEAQAGQLVYMGYAPGSHPASSQSQGSGQDLPFWPDANLSSHAGDLQAISYQVQDMQVAAIHLSRAGGACEGSFLQGSYCHCSDLMVCAWSLGMHPGQDSLDKASASMLVFPAL